MGRPETSDGRVIGNLIRRDHSKRNILSAAPLDHAAGTFTDAIRVHE